MSNLDTTEVFKRRIAEIENKYLQDREDGFDAETLQQILELLPQFVDLMLDEIIHWFAMADRISENENLDQDDSRWFIDRIIEKHPELGGRKGVIIAAINLYHLRQYPNRLDIAIKKQVASLLDGSKEHGQKKPRRRKGRRKPE